MRHEGTKDHNHDMPLDQLPNLLVMSMQFVEMRTDKELIVINQDDIHHNLLLKEGDALTF